jgi:hypothetical protein
MPLVARASGPAECRWTDATGWGSAGKLTGTWNLMVIELIVLVHCLERGPALVELGLEE